MKACTMNCGPAAGDTRSEKERRAECDDCIDDFDDFRADCIERATEVFSSDVIDIDDNAKISEGEDGTWVQAWVFVRMTRPDDEEETCPTTDANT